MPDALEQERAPPFTAEQQERFDAKLGELVGFGLDLGMAETEARWHALEYDPPDLRPSPRTRISSANDAARPSAFVREPLDWPVLAASEPPERWFAIDEWLPMGTTTLLAGRGGIGKSLLAQSIGSALAIGHPFLGNVAMPLRVLAWFGEDDRDELWRRQAKIAQHFDVPLGKFADWFIVETFERRDCTLMDCDRGGMLVRTSMYDELAQQVADYKAEVVILDNVSRLFAGNESDRNQVTRFIAALNAAANGAAVLLLAHPGRAIGSEYSGSSAWENAVRTRWFMSDRPPDAHLYEETEAEDTGRRYLAKRKANYSARDMRTFRYENGVLVPETPAVEPFGVVASIASGNDERVVLAAFRKLAGDLNQQPTDGGTSPSSLPKLILEFSLNEGRTKRDLTKAMRRLMVDGRLVREVVGKYPNRSPRYGLREAP